MMKEIKPRENRILFAKSSRSHGFLVYNKERTGYYQAKRIGKEMNGE
jgi:hypothetical protein